MAKKKCKYQNRRFMMKKQFTSIFFIFLLIFASRVASQEIISPEYEVVKKTIEQSIGWAIEKDFDSMFHLWDADMFHFWVFSNSQVIGLDSFKNYAEQWKDPNFRGTRFEFKDLRIVFSCSGDVAWYSCHLDDCGSFEGKESCLENVFQTGVLEKKDGRWVHVLMHGSYPVDKIPENFVRKYYSNLFEKKE